MSSSNPVRSFYDTAEWQQYFDTVQGTPQLMVIFFSEIWCGPSNTMAPVIADLANTYKDVAFVKLDAANMFIVAEAYNIRETVPTFVAVRHGVEVDRLVGAKTDKLIAMIERHRVA